MARYPLLAPLLILFASNFVPSLSFNETRLHVLLDIYNPYRLITSFNRSQETPCKADLSSFFDELQNGTLWALQMSDASGSYNGELYWGNTYWLGSSTQCYHSSSRPPFETGFFVIKTNIHLRLPLLPHGRAYYLGLCLPMSCKGPDAEELVRLSADSVENVSSERNLTITVVKDPNNYYYFTQDPTFWILAVTTVIMFLLVLAGTALELYYDYLAGKKPASDYLYDNYTYEIAKNNQAMDKTISTNNNHNVEAGASDSSERTSVDSEESSKTNGWIQALLAFSAKRNLLTICDKSVGDDTIPTIHGIRSISMVWVILGHSCIIAFKFADNTDYRKLVEKELVFETINKGPYAVDSFFFISGLLVSFLYFRTIAKNDISKITKTTGFKSNVLEFLGMLFYRFFRLTTPYFFVLGVVEINSKWFYYNSVFEPPANDYENCPNYWWRNLLYVNTLFPFKDMCMLWSWYLADDTQFYILGAILLIVAVKHFRTAFGFFMVFLVSSWITTGYIAYTNEHLPNSDDPLALFDKIYDKPWTRLGPYMVGMAVGWILFKTDCKINMSKTVVVIGWISSFGTLLFLVYGLFGSTLSTLAGAAFSSLSHTAWALALAWIVIACSTGYGGYVKSILACRILYPFSRVTYCAYLVHPVIIRAVIMRMDAPVHLAPEMVAVLFFGQLVLSYIFAFILSLMFEAPVVSLLRLISPTKRKAK